MMGYNKQQDREDNVQFHRPIKKRHAWNYYSNYQPKQKKKDVV